MKPPRPIPWQPAAVAADRTASQEPVGGKSRTRARRWLLNLARVGALVGILVGGVVLAQRGFRGWGRWGRSYESYQTPRQIPQHADQTPTWTNAPGFAADTFTFVRIKRARDPYSSGGTWWTDTPDSDLNLAYRLHQVTSLKVDPNGRFLHLTDPALANYPMIYMVEPGSLSLTQPEIVALRGYLLNGGFLWLDDFWGRREWQRMAHVMKQVFPHRDFVELPLSHPLYHGVFDIKTKGQVPNVRLGTWSQYDPEHRTWERPDAKVVHHRVIYDDHDRIMVLATHNTDNGDGWEWEGDNQYYFREFSEKTAYPLAINVLYYVMTH